MFVELLCLHVVASFAFSRWPSLAGPAWTFCSLAGCTGVQQPVPSSVDVTENSGCMTYVLSKWVISFKNNATMGLFLEAFFLSELGALE